MSSFNDLVVRALQKYTGLTTRNYATLIRTACNQYLGNT